jgi:hypothetical protein
MAAIMGLETQVMAVFNPESGNGSWAHGKPERAEEPVTMAVAAPADTAAAAASRWTAVATALAPEEAALSLEQEMQKAYADFAAAESGHTAGAASVADKSIVPEASSAPVAVADPPASEPEASQAVAQIPPTLAPEVVQPLTAVSEAATEAMSAAVKELEVVAAKYEAEHIASPEPFEDKSLKAEALESPTPAVLEAPVQAEAKLEEKAEEKFEEKIEELPVEPAKTSPEEIASAVTTVFAAPETDPHITTPQAEEQQEEQQASAPAETEEPVAETAVDEEPNTRTLTTDPVPVSSASTARGTDEMSKRESETAAAWASWRKIRETGRPKSEGDASERDSVETTQDKAAMAVAAGAESKPEDVSSLDSDPEIASLVDSVLADMRPKIVEEIARKLGKKK